MKVKSLLAATVVLIAATISAQTQTTGTFKPQVGQPGKDVVWVPTPQALVDTMLDMAKVTPNDLLIDLGSGDGRTVISAAKQGVQAVGVEYNPDMVQLSRTAARTEGVTERATFVQADLFKTDLSKATVITMFLLPSINMQLRPTLLNLKPGTRIVSNTFDMEDWMPDDRRSIGPAGCQSWCTAMLWIVPARVAGTWKTPQGTLTLVQQFQVLTGTLGSAPVTGKVTGDDVEFNAGSTRYSGRLNGTTIQGAGWSASRMN